MASEESTQNRMTPPQEAKKVRKQSSVATSTPSSGHGRPPTVPQLQARLEALKLQDPVLWAFIQDQLRDQQTQESQSNTALSPANKKRKFTADEEEESTPSNIVIATEGKPDPSLTSQEQPPALINVDVADLIAKGDRPREVNDIVHFGGPTLILDSPTEAKDGLRVPVTAVQGIYHDRKNTNYTTISLTELDKAAKTNVPSIDELPIDWLGKTNKAHECLNCHESGKVPGYAKSDMSWKASACRKCTGQGVPCLYINGQQLMMRALHRRLRGKSEPGEPRFWIWPEAMRRVYSGELNKGDHPADV